MRDTVQINLQQQWSSVNRLGILGRKNGYILPNFFKKIAVGKPRWALFICKSSQERYYPPSYPYWLNSPLAAKKAASLGNSSDTYFFNSLSAYSLTLLFANSHAKLFYASLDVVFESLLVSFPGKVLINDCGRSQWGDCSYYAKKKPNG